MSSLSLELFREVNYWGVLVAGLVTFFLGGLWYSPALFEGAWMNARGYTEEDVSLIQARLAPLGFVATFVVYLAMAGVFALLITALNVTTLAAGVALALMIWVGFVAPTGIAVNLFSKLPLTSWVIDAGYQLLFLVTTGAILARWQ